MEVVDAIVSEQILLMIVIERIVSNINRVDMVDMVVTIVDDWLVDVHIGAVINALVRVLISAISCGGHNWWARILASSLATRNTAALGVHV